jgi:8-amino-7-oxononanoate synthase
LVKEYILNYSKPTIYSTSLSNMAVIAVGCALDIFEDGSSDKVTLDSALSYLCSYLKKSIQLAEQLLNASRHLILSLQARLVNIPPHILSLPSHLEHKANAVAGQPPATYPTPIVPLMTSKPFALSESLAEKGIIARPIHWPAVPKGAERIRISLHASNTLAAVDELVNCCLDWAHSTVKEEERVAKPAKL